MIEKRRAIMEAKRRLYHELIKLEGMQWTDDDRRIARALISDSEIQSLFNKAKP